MQTTTITYYPVGNGDNSLLSLEDDTHVLIDCNIRAPGEGVYDVKADLLNRLRRTPTGVPTLDAFILSHPDRDHCHGFTTHFYTGNPKSYGESHKNSNMILIEELWATPRILRRYKEHNGELCDDAKSFQAEYERRATLHRNGDAAANEPGNRLRLIGYTPQSGSLEKVRTVPGQEVTSLNGKVRSDIAFFAHAPFSDAIEDEEHDRNDTSLVLHVRFHRKGEPNVTLALFGGDAPHHVWDIIQRRSRAADLEWDLLLAPHHCSWTFFNDVPQDENPEPKKSALAMLDRRRQGARVLASSKPIRDDDDNPPHFQAARLYRAAVGDDAFTCTGSHPDEAYPQPVTFAVTTNGPVKQPAKPRSAITSSAAVQTAIRTPQTYG